MSSKIQHPRKQNISNPLSGSKPGNIIRSPLLAVLCILAISCVLATYAWFIVTIFFQNKSSLSSKNSAGRNTVLQTNEVEEQAKDFVVDNAKGNDGLVKNKAVDSTTNLSPNKHPQEITTDKDGNVSGGTLTLRTEHGPIRIVFRPDLSPESVSYIRQIVSLGSCTRCNFYRAEKPGILQGVITNSKVRPNKVLGKCPPEYHEITAKQKHKCPEHDPHCRCHGPVMTRGMVGWAAGGGGPDFFINTYKRKAVWWENQHTVWGEIQDDASLALIDEIYDLPTTKRKLTYLDKQLEFTLEITNDSLESSTTIA